MKTERFYYSAPLKVCNQEVIVAYDKHIVAEGDIKGKSVNIPRITICGLIDTDAHIISFGVARCSPKDIFTREEGRNISRNRALTNPYKVIVYSDSDNIIDTFIEISTQIEYEILQMGYPIKLHK